MTIFCLFLVIPGNVRYRTRVLRILNFYNNHCIPDSGHLKFCIVNSEFLCWPRHVSLKLEGTWNLIGVRRCIQKFPDGPPGARTANGTALCHQVQLYRFMWVSLVSLVTITLCVTSQRMLFIIIIIIIIIIVVVSLWTQSGNFWITLVHVAGRLNEMKCATFIRAMMKFMWIEWEKRKKIVWLGISILQESGWWPSELRTGLLCAELTFVLKF
jgi:hypothetical protein